MLTLLYSSKAAGSEKNTRKVLYAHEILEYTKACYNEQEIKDYRVMDPEALTVAFIAVNSESDLKPAPVNHERRKSPGLIQQAIPAMV